MIGGYRIFTGCFLVLCMIFSCGESIEPESFLNVRDAVALDNGNQGSSADIEIFFDKQFDYSGISLYRIYIVKSENVSNYDVSSLLALEEQYYDTVLPKDIYPIQGKTLKVGLVDTDGDTIKEGVSYHAAIISMPMDEELWSRSLTLTQKGVILASNNLVRPYSRDLESGYGDLAMNSQGQLYMSSYNILDDLFGSSDEETSLYTFSNTGRENAIVNYRGILGGNAFDSQDVLYQSVIDKSEVLMVDASGAVSNLSFGDFKIERPDGIYINSNDEIFIVDNKSGTVFTVSNDGTVSRYASVGENARGIVGDEEGNLYVSINDEDGRIMKIDTEKQVTRFADIPTFRPEDYDLTYIMWLGYLTYHDNNLYVPGVGTNQIYKVDLTGNVEVFAGSGRRLFPKGDAKNAHFNRPMSIVFDEDGSTAYVNSCLDVTPLHTQASYPSKVYAIDVVD